MRVQYDCSPNDQIPGALLRGGSKVIRKLPGPLQKIFARSGFIGSIEGARISVADTSYAVGRTDIEGLEDKYLKEHLQKF
jgi:hypothetical protein